MHNSFPLKPLPDLVQISVSSAAGGKSHHPVQIIFSSAMHFHVQLLLVRESGLWACEKLGNFEVKTLFLCLAFLVQWKTSCAEAKAIKMACSKSELCPENNKNTGNVCSWNIWLTLYLNKSNSSERRKEMTCTTHSIIIKEVCYEAKIILKKIKWLAYSFPTDPVFCFFSNDPNFFSFFRFYRSKICDTKLHYSSNNNKKLF